MKSRKCKTSFLAIKIDLEKACDKLEWNFIKKTLTKLNFSEQMIKWIMTCIETVTYTLSINCNISETWIPRREIKQGDLLSPYNFICYLNFLILQFLEGHRSRTSNFDAFTITKYNPHIPILCLADDRIIYSKINE